MACDKWGHWGFRVVHGSLLLQAAFQRRPVPPRGRSGAFARFPFSSEEQLGDREESWSPTPPGPGRTETPDRCAPLDLTGCGAQRGLTAPLASGRMHFKRAGVRLSEIGTGAA